jgi:2-polyprenyl-6-methoxyphenol hydroxylase-like FAD-dependent oxidoreductase
MPPQGEGVGMVLEDVVVFARLVGRYGAAQLNDIFARYEELRRKRIDAAYDEANLRWETAKDFGWLAQSMKEWLMPIFLWWSAKARNKAFEEDLTV